MPRQEVHEQIQDVFSKQPYEISFFTCRNNQSCMPFLFNIHPMTAVFLFTYGRNRSSLSVFSFSGLLLVIFMHVFSITTSNILSCFLYIDFNQFWFILLVKGKFMTLNTGSEMRKRLLSQRLFSSKTCSCYFYITLLHLFRSIIHQNKYTTLPLFLIACKVPLFIIP